MMEKMDDNSKKRSKDTHQYGTYICANVDHRTTKQLADWVKANNIPNPLDPKEYHATIIYSRVGVPGAEDYPLELPITAKVAEWKVFPSQSGAKCLVLALKSVDLDHHHSMIRKLYGATHDYPSYEPHVTVSYDYGSSTPPSAIPDFDIVFDDVKIEPLNETWGS